MRLCDSAITLASYLLESIAFFSPSLHRAHSTKRSFNTRPCKAVTVEVHMFLGSPGSPGLRWRRAIQQRSKAKIKQPPLEQSDHGWRGRGIPRPNAHPHTLRESNNNIRVTQQLLNT